MIAQTMSLAAPDFDDASFLEHLVISNHRNRLYAFPLNRFGNDYRERLTRAWQEKIRVLPFDMRNYSPVFVQRFQWQKEALSQNILQVFQRWFRYNIVEMQIVLWQQLHYNLCNPPVLGGSQHFDVYSIECDLPIYCKYQQRSRADVTICFLFSGIFTYCFAVGKIVLPIFFNESAPLPRISSRASSSRS